MKKKRIANMELLRIIAMLMVVMLHYLSKGMQLPAMTGPQGVRGMLAWGMESLAIVAVNVYMLISGYFLTEGRFRTGRLIQLVCQVLFYSILVTAVLLCTGQLVLSDLTIYELLQVLFPLEMNQYWFATAYCALYLLTPILRSAVHHMGQKQLKITIFLLLLVFSVNKSLLPFRLETDQKGYDVLWFLCVFLVAAYIRLYGIKWFDKAKKGFTGYLVCCAGMFVWILGMHFFYLKTGRLGDVLINAHNYNHILNLVASVCLFYGFYHLKLKEGFFSRWVLKIAPYTFGVYLLHEQLFVRYLWPKWLGAENVASAAELLGNALVSVAVVFTAGIIVDMIRAALFALAGRVLNKGRIVRLLDQIDEGLKGEES